MDIYLRSDLSCHIGLGHGIKALSEVIRRCLKDEHRGELLCRLYDYDFCTKLYNK